MLWLGKLLSADAQNGEEAKFMIDSTFGDMAALLEMRRAELIEAAPRLQPLQPRTISSVLTQLLMMALSLAHTSVHPL